MESLFEKLKSLGVQVGASNLSPPPPKQAKYRIEDVVKGKYIQTHLGNTFLAENQYNGAYSHGDINLHVIPVNNILWELGNVNTGQDNLEDCIFLDAETSGLSGGTGTFIFLFGLGFFKDNIFHVKQFFMDTPYLEPAFLNELDNILKSYKTIISFNGKSFDIPLLRSRFVLNRLQTPFDSYGHIDLLHISRKIWRNRLTSRTLCDLEREIIHFQRSKEEVPGWLVPQIYFDYLKDGDARPLEGVFYHNAMDVVSMAALLKHISSLLSGMLLEDNNFSLDQIALARLYEESGYIDKAIESYEFALDKGLPEEFFVSTLQKYANIFKKQGVYQKSVEIWTKAATHHDIPSCVELAKYFEHQIKDFSEALRWVDLAIEYAGQISALPSGYNNMDLQKRKNRLITRQKFWD